MVLVLATGCQDIDIKKQIQERYKQSVQFFDPELVSHFPKKLPDSCWYLTTVTEADTLEMAGFGVNKLFMAYSFSQYKNIAAQFRNLPNTTYKATDSSLLLIFDYCDVIEIDGDIFRNQEPPERQALAKHNVATATSLPVPLFEINKYQANTISGLGEDFNLYILDAKPGKYLDDKYLQECECLPEKWKHGYSKGVAMSDEQKVIIYWIVVW